MPFGKAPRAHYGAFTLRTGAVLGLSLVVLACGEEESATELNPAGPPMVQQVFVQEKTTATRERFQLAFGDHPDIPLPDDDPAFGDDRMVVNAVARGTAKIRVVLDELVYGNDIEEIACADGTFSRVPRDADPDDIAKCAGPVESLVECTAVCIGDSGPVGILDENEDAAADDVRMIDYGGGELAVQVVCGGMSIPLDREASFYNPSGNQLLPAVNPGQPNAPENINGLGPAVVLIPSNGFRTGSDCTIEFRPEVTDKDGNQVCAPPGGDITQDCNPGDTSAISFTTEPLALRGSFPVDGDTDVPVTDPNSTDATILLSFVAAIDPATLSAITLADGGGVDVPVTPAVQADDQSTVTVTVPGGYASDTEYTLTIGTGLTDIYGGALPTAITITYTTGTAAAVPDAGMPDALL